MNLMDAPDHAIEGWTRYVLEASRDLPGTAPVDERMASVLSGTELPYWLEDGIRIKLVGLRGQAMVEKTLSRVGQRPNG